MYVVYILDRVHKLLNKPKNSIVSYKYDRIEYQYTNNHHEITCALFSEKLSMELYLRETSYIG